MTSRSVSELPAGRLTCVCVCVFFHFFLGFCVTADFVSWWLSRNENDADWESALFGYDFYSMVGHVYLIT